MLRYWIPILVSFFSIACINVQVQEESPKILTTEIPLVQDTLNEFSSSQEIVVMLPTVVPTPTPITGTTILKKAVEKYDPFAPRSYSTVFTVNTQGRCRPDICREFNQEANEFEGIKQYGYGSLISDNEFFGQDRFQYQGTNYFSEHRCVDGVNYETDQDNGWSEVGACRNSRIDSDLFSLIKNIKNSGLLQLGPIGQVSQNDYKTYFHLSWGTSEINDGIREILTSLNMDSGTVDYFHIEYWIDSDSYNLNSVSVNFYDYQNDLEIGRTYLDNHLFEVALEIKLLPFDGDISWLQKPEIFVREETLECSDSERSFDAANGQWECLKKDPAPKNLLGTKKPNPTPTPESNPKQPTKYIDSDSIVYWISSAGSTGPLLSEGDFTTVIVAADVGDDNKVQGANESNLKSAVVMSATYGDGKVVAFSHDGFLTNVVPHLGLLEGSNSAATGNTAFDNDDFLIEVINWVGRHGDLDVKIASNHNEWANWITLAPLREVLVETGYSPSRIDGVITSSELRKAGVLILGNAWGEISDEEISAIHDFVENGGGLIMAGLGWSWLTYADNPNFDTALRGKVGVKPSLDNYPMNKVAKAFGIQWADSVIYDPYTESESIFIAYNLTDKLPKSAIASTIGVVETINTLQCEKACEGLISSASILDLIESAGDSNRYRFKANAGNLINLKTEVRQGDLDPMITLFGPNGDYLHTDAYSSFTSNIDDASIAGWYAETTGYYEVLIEASNQIIDSSEKKTGDYFLDISLYDPPQFSWTNPNNTDTGGGSIKFGEQISAALEKFGDIDDWHFTGKAGDRIKVILEHGATKELALLHPRLQLISPGLETQTSTANGYIAKRDVEDKKYLVYELLMDQWNGEKTLTADWVLEQTGTYTIRVTNINWSGYGPYIFKVKQSNTFPEHPNNPDLTKGSLSRN